MAAARVEHAVAVLDGKLYAAGGLGAGYSALSSVERYDPALDASVSGTVPVLLKSTIYFLTALARFRAEGVVKRWGAHCVLFGWGSISGTRL